MLWQGVLTYSAGLNATEWDLAQDGEGKTRQPGLLWSRVSECEVVELGVGVCVHACTLRCLGLLPSYSPHLLIYSAAGTPDAVTD